MLGRQQRHWYKDTIADLEKLTNEWRREHHLLLDVAAAAPDRDARTAMTFRAKRHSGEFLLGEIARRGFTPAYGFPTDVVTFTNLLHGSKEDSEGNKLHSLGKCLASARSGCSRIRTGSRSGH